MKGKIDYSIFLGGSLALAVLYFVTGLSELKLVLAIWFFFSQVGILVFRYLTTGKIYLRTSYVEGGAAKKWILVYGLIGLLCVALVAS